MVMRKTTKLRAVAVRRRVANKKGRVIEFPQRLAADDVVSDTIIFEIGSDRFAIKWSAEIVSLPPAGPVVVERKQRLKFGPLASAEALNSANRE